jgi:hypothetical protein
VDRGELRRGGAEEAAEAVSRQPSAVSPEEAGEGEGEGGAGVRGRAAGAARRRGAVIVDLGRNAVAGLALAEQIDASDAAVHLFVAGVRDADQTRKLRALGSAESFRAPPGDPAVADAVARTITGGARRAP